MPRATYVCVLILWAISISAQDLRITMPPYPHLFEGLEVIGPLLERALSEGDWRLLPTVANRMPTAASYLRAPGDTVYRPSKFDVLRVVDGRVAEITTFGPEPSQFGLPPALGVVTQRNKPAATPPSGAYARPAVTAPPRAHEAIERPPRRPSRTSPLLTPRRGRTRGWRDRS
jgi:hypothetical protein